MSAVYNHFNFLSPDLWLHSIEGTRHENTQASSIEQWRVDLKDHKAQEDTYFFYCVVSGPPEYFCVLECIESCQCHNYDLTTK